MPTRRTAAKDLSYVQLEKRLVLVAWLNEQFGFNTNAAALMDAKEAAEGFNADGRSYLSVRLETQGRAGAASGACRLRQQHPRPPARHQHQTRHAHRAALLPVFGRALRRGLLGLVLPLPRCLAGCAEPLRTAPQHGFQAAGCARRPAVHAGRLAQAGVLDRHRRRQDAAAAHQLPPVPALQRSAR